MRVLKNDHFYCFSPPVMAVTAIIELGLLIYTLLRYQRTLVIKLCAAMLFFLAAFQVAEYQVCGGLGLQASTWSRFGFMVIATLPAIGIHMILTIAKKNWLWLKAAAYSTAGFWIVLFAFSRSAFNGYRCGGNYIIYQINQTYGTPYLFHYYFWLFVGVGLAWRLASQAKTTVRKALYLFIVGYGVFIIPTAVVNTLNPKTTEGLPSILCGFAIIFAIILVFAIAPLIGRKKQLTK